jgi:Tol biopolymer transport system component
VASALAVAGLWIAQPAPAAPGAARVLFRSDWSGTSQIYAADPAGARPTAQVTFGRAPACEVAACGYTNAVPSPDGKYVLYGDWASCGPSVHPSSLFVARADGTHARRLARSRSTSFCVTNIAGKWAADSRRIAYTIDGELHVARVDRRNDRVVGTAADFGWSPDGKSLAYTTAHSSGLGSLWVARAGPGRMIALEAADFTWSPNGRWIAYDFPTTLAGSRELDIVRPDGTGRRSLLTAYLGLSKWSGDSRLLAVPTPDGVTIVDVVKGSHLLEPGLRHLPGSHTAMCSRWSEATAPTSSTSTPAQRGYSSVTTLTRLAGRPTADHSRTSRAGSSARTGKTTSEL